jgi:hypothetical protein
MQAWMIALFVGFLVVGLGRQRPTGRTNRLVILVVIVVVGYEAAKIHAF